MHDVSLAPVSPIQVHNGRVGFRLHAAGVDMDLLEELLVDETSAANQPEFPCRPLHSRIHDLEVSWDDSLFDELVIVLCLLGACQPTVELISRLGDDASLRARVSAVMVFVAEQRVDQELLSFIDFSPLDENAPGVPSPVDIRVAG